MHLIILGSGIDILWKIVTFHPVSFSRPLGWRLFGWCLSGWCLSGQYSRSFKSRIRNLHLRLPSFTKMEEGKANLCHYCLELFPIEDNGHSTRPFHSDVATMLLEAGKCHFCAVIQNRMNLDGISQAHASKDSPMHNSASLRVRLKEPHQSEGGVRWGILEISIRMPDAQGEIVKDHTFSITTCERSCRYYQERFFHRSTLNVKSTQKPPPSLEISG